MGRAKHIEKNDPQILLNIWNHQQIQLEQDPKHQCREFLVDLYYEVLTHEMEAYGFYYKSKTHMKWKKK